MSACAEGPVFIEPSIETDRAYAMTFLKLGKFKEEHGWRYREVWNTISPFVYPGDLGISVIPERKVLEVRIAGRGREYEQAWSSDFKDTMVDYCRNLEDDWQSRGALVKIGHWEYVRGGNAATNRVLMLGEFGLRATKLWAEGGGRVYWPESWPKYETRSWTQPIPRNTHLRR